MTICFLLDENTHVISLQVLLYSKNTKTFVLDEKVISLLVVLLNLQERKLRLCFTIGQIYKADT